MTRTNNQGEMSFLGSAEREVSMENDRGLDNRHRDKNGEISRKHGNTLISTLRKTYGSSFAVGFPDDAKLHDVLAKLDEPSLSKLVQDHLKKTAAEAEIPRSAPEG
jgi:hypothetical protein